LSPEGKSDRCAIRGRRVSKMHDSELM
jgi:hypothetical protein